MGDSREQKLPMWARELINELRAQVIQATAERDEARVAQDVATGSTRPDASNIVVDLDGGAQVGLPDDATVTFDRALTVERCKAGGVTIESDTGTIAVWPLGEYRVRVMKVS